MASHSEMKASNASRTECLAPEIVSPKLETLSCGHTPTYKSPSRKISTRTSICSSIVDRKRFSAYYKHYYKHYYIQARSPPASTGDTWPILPYANKGGSAQTHPYWSNLISRCTGTPDFQDNSFFGKNTSLLGQIPPKIYL